MSETDKPNNWLEKIYSSHFYFVSKTNHAPTTLFLHPRIKLELFNQLQALSDFEMAKRFYSSFMRCEVMGCEVKECADVKDFLWALTVDE